MFALETKKGSSPANIDAMLFKISERKANGKICIFKTASVPEKTLWLTELKKAIEAAKREKSSDVEDFTSDEDAEHEIGIL
jgi:hypothetical protein